MSPHAYYFFIHSLFPEAMPYAKNHLSWLQAEPFRPGLQGLRRGMEAEALILARRGSARVGSSALALSAPSGHAEEYPQRPPGQALTAAGPHGAGDAGREAQ